MEEEVDNESDKENPFVSIPDIKIKTPRQQDSKGKHMYFYFIFIFIK